MRNLVVSLTVVGIIALIMAMGAGDPTGPNPFVTLGILNGAIYGLVAIGLVLVYKGTRVFNFAAGEFGTLGAFFVFYLFDAEFLGLPYGVAVILALIGALIVGLILERIVIRPLMNAPRITVMVATIAIALLAIGTEILFSKAEPRTLSPAFPATAGGEPAGVYLPGFEFQIDPQRLLTLAVLLLVGAALAYFFSRTDLGLAVLATSQDNFATKVVGIGVERMSMFIWGTAAILGAIAGILFVPISGTLIPGLMTTSILIPAFTAAVLGGMTSLPGVFLGGIAIGFVQSTSLWASGHYFMGDTPIQQTIPGAEQIAIFALLLIVLLARPQGLLGKEA